MEDYAPFQRQLNLFFFIRKTPTSVSFMGFRLGALHGEFIRIHTQILERVYVTAMPTNEPGIACRKTFSPH
jgi:hypothetical protein